MSESDQLLISYVNSGINAGHRSIAIPRSLLEKASRDAIETVRQLCALNGVRLIVVNG